METAHTLCTSTKSQSGWAKMVPHFQEYTRNLASQFTAEPFKVQLSGDKAARDEKGKQLAELIQQESQAVLSNAGLPSDYQMLPILNFRDIASEEEAERNLKLLEDIYVRVSDQASFLSADEIRKFAEFRSKALDSVRMQLTHESKNDVAGRKVMVLLVKIIR